jgi:hypothetical protein
MEPTNPQESELLGLFRTLDAQRQKALLNLAKDMAAATFMQFYPMQKCRALPSVKRNEPKEPSKNGQDHHLSSIECGKNLRRSAAPLVLVWSREPDRSV